MNVISRLLRREPTEVAESSPPGGSGLGTWCLAPTTALYFDPSGAVYPCCTGRTPLGWVSGPNRQTLREIWEGSVAQSVRQAVAVDDLSIGCEGCAISAASGGRHDALAINFDRWHGLEQDLPIDLEFAMSNTCNLQCVMCNGDFSSAIRSQREHRPPLRPQYDDQFFDELAELLPLARRVAFKGGEPFLQRESRRVMDMMLDLGVDAEYVVVTTNGTVWSDRVEHLVRSLRMSPIVSIDAMDRDLLERTRVGVDADELWTNIDHFHRVAVETGRPFTFSYCILATTWQELAPLLQHAQDRGVYVYVALVNQPDPFSLFTLTAEELDDAAAKMEVQGQSLRLDSPELIDAWNRGLDWVRYCAAQVRLEEAALSTPVHVDLEPSRRRSSSDGGESTSPASTSSAATPARHPEAIDALRSWSGGVEPIELLAGADGIEAVTLPDWVADWKQEWFLAKPTSDLVRILSELSDLALVAEVELVDQSVTLAWVRDQDGVELARAVTVRSQGRERVVLALAPTLRDRIGASPTSV